MKQHITPKQALEITEEQFYSLFCTDQTSFDRIVKRKDYANFHHKKVTIGKCIDILKSYDKCVNITNAVFGSEYDNRFTWEIRLRHLDKYVYADELIDSLWEMIKRTI